MNAQLMLDQSTSFTLCVQSTKLRSTIMSYRTAFDSQHGVVSMLPLSSCACLPTPANPQVKCFSTA